MNKNSNTKQPLTKAQLKLQKEIAEFDAELAAECATAKAKGAKYQLTTWVHPGRGSDYFVTTYWAYPPTKEEARKIAKQYRSKLLDDYSYARL